MLALTPLRLALQARPKNMTDEQWVDQINDTIIKV
jgi:hypothetical protein